VCNGERADGNGRDPEIFGSDLRLLRRARGGTTISQEHAFLSAVHCDDYQHKMDIVIPVDH
jgi:hypothetical protein